MHKAVYRKCFYCYNHTVLSGASVLLNKYTESTWPMHIKDINCTGSEGLVLDCSHNEISGYECSALHDAGVICQCKCTQLWLIDLLQNIIHIILSQCV